MIDPPEGAVCPHCSVSLRPENATAVPDGEINGDPVYEWVCSSCAVAAMIGVTEGH